MLRVTPNLTFGHKFKIHRRAATKICCRLKLEAISSIFLIFRKNLRIFVFHVCVLNSACIICPVLPLSCPESHNSFSCILIRASLIVTGQDTVSHSPVSRDICILLCSVPGSCHQARWPKFKYEYFKINTQNIHTHRAEFLLIKASLTAEAWLCQERESGSCVQRAHHQQIRALPIKLIEKYES